MSRTNATNFTRLVMSAQTQDDAVVFTFADTAGAPDAPFYAVVNLLDDARREVVKISTKSATTLECASINDRYLDGSAASSGITHPLGSQLLVAPVAQNLEDIWDVIDALDVNDLDTVNVVSPSDGDLLTYNSGTAKWEAEAPSTTVTDSLDARLTTAEGDIVALENASLAVETSASNTVALDFTIDRLVNRTATGSVTVTGSNYTAGKSITVRIVAGSSSRSLSFPNAWKFVSFEPSSIAANKTGVLAATCFGNSEGDVVAAWAVES